MKGYSRIIYFVIILSVSVLALAEQCSKIHKEYAKAGDNFFNAYIAAVNASIEGSENITDLLTEMKQMSTEFMDVGNKTCVKGKLNPARNHKIFLELIEFALSNVTVIQDLENKGVFQCIEPLRSNITKCLADNTVLNRTRPTEYGELMKKSHLTFSETACSQTKLIKKCTSKILEKNCDSAVKYVDSLFNFIIDSTHCNITTNLLKSSSHRLTGFWSTFTMFALLSGLKMLIF